MAEKAQESFPRGGKKPEVKKSSTMKTKKHKTHIKKKIGNVVGQDIDLIADTAKRLSNATLVEGMVILCRVSHFHVERNDIIVSIPGGHVGVVEEEDIGISYLCMLQQEMLPKKLCKRYFVKDLYKPGDYIVCCVKTINLNHKWLYTLSLMPQLINQNLHKSYLTKGAKIIGNIKSIEDYGYVIDIGIVDIKAFLPIKNVEKGKKYFLDCQVMCVIKEILIQHELSIIQLSTKKKDLNKISNYDIASIDFLVPGTRLSLCVTKILSNGLQVTFGKNNIGYINRMYLDKPLSAYEDNMVVTGTLLYIAPTVKFAYFSLLTDIPEKEEMREGDIINKAKVLYRESNGIVFKLSESGIRGFVSFRRTDVQFAKIKNVFKKDSIHKCRIIAYNWMEHIYVCTIQRDILEDDYILPSDIKYGDILTVTIVDIEEDKGQNIIHVRAGKKIQGVVPWYHVSDTMQSNGPSELTNFKIGDKVKARILSYNESRSYVIFTLKQSLIESKLPILHDMADAKCGVNYHCTIFAMTYDVMLVKFYGKLTNNILNDDGRDIRLKYSVGQTITVCVHSIDKERLNLKIVTEEKKQINLLVGETVEGIITESSLKGVHLKIQIDEDFVIGFIPAGHMALCLQIGSLLASQSIPGEKIEGFVFATQPTLLLSRTFVPHEQSRNFESLKKGDCIPCSIKHIFKHGLELILPINNYPKLSFISYKNIPNFKLLYENQIMFARIYEILDDKTIMVTTELNQVWENVVKQISKNRLVVDTVYLYLNKLSELANNPFYRTKSISSVSLGQKITGVVEKITEYGLVLWLRNDLKGTVRNLHYSGNLQVGDQVSGVILWKNYVHEIVEVSLLSNIVNSISEKQKTLPELPTDVTLKGKILILTTWFLLVLVKRKGKGYLVALPVRRFVNDITPVLSPYVIHAKIRLRIVKTRSESFIVPIGMLKSTFEIPKPAITINITNTAKKRKRSEQHDLMDISIKVRKIENEQNESAIEEKENKIKESKMNDNSTSDSFNESKIGENKSIAGGSHIPQCGFSWDDKASSTVTTKTETSSDDEEESEEEPKQKKRKLNAAERREQQRQKEREIHLREEALASNEPPNSIDQFDRLVLSSPNSSLVWIQYMVYHLQTTEIDKARMIARRAIKTINFREENERLNVWYAWLNLESTFGTAESLNDVFQEAVKHNDAFKIYKHMLKVHTDAGRVSELNTFVCLMIKKFKKDFQTWLACGAALLKVNLIKKLRKIMQQALQSLPQSQHVKLLMGFALLEDKIGDKERRREIFEDLLNSHPECIDVWLCYMDCLIKSGDIVIARRVLKRAYVQFSSTEKMKILLKMLKAFAIRHGTPQTIPALNEMIADLAKRVMNQSNVLCHTEKQLNIE